MRRHANEIESDEAYPFLIFREGDDALLGGLTFGQVKRGTEPAGAVNVTLGLPFIRTSPDHGTAFDIAGTDKPNPSSLIAALRLAARMAATKTT